jgi:hypothetical protein
MNVLKHEEIISDIHEYYYKQTNRNRCNIITANGVMPLIIPVNTLGNHTPVKDVKIDYSYPWQRVHLHAIISAYAHAPYFEHYRSHIEKLFSTQPAMLYEWNNACSGFAASALRLKWNPAISENYIDRDNSIDLKLPRYSQVFEERHGFIQDLSILDLLFCCGPSSADILLSR